MAPNARRSSATRRLALEADRALRAARLRQFIGWLLAAAAGFGLVYLVGGLILPSGALLGAAVDVTLFAIALLVARRRVDAKRVEDAAEIVGCGLFVMCMVGAPLLPWLRTALVLIPLAGVALVLPDLEGTRLRRLLLVAFASEALIVAVSTWVPALFPPPPEVLRSTVSVAASTISLGLTFLLLYRDADRLRRSIAAADFHALKVQAVVDRAPIVIFAVDREGRFTLSEGRGLVRVGLEPGEIVGRSAFSLYADSVWMTGAMRRALDGEDISTAGGSAERQWEAHLRPLDDGGAIGVVIDITERQRAQAELQEALRVRDEFLSIASHELKTPLTPLSLEVSAIQRAADRGDLDRVRERAAKLHRHVGRLTALAEQLLDVGRIRAGRISLHRNKEDLGDIVRAVVARMESEAERAGCKVTVSTEGDGQGDWDGSRLDQIVTNLVANAVKYGAGAPIDIEVHDQGAQLQLMIRDRGMGIAPEDQARIFQRFERAVNDRNFGGLGLGLFIVRELVEAHGGTISVDSAKGEGATFLLTLPRAARASEART